MAKRVTSPDGYITAQEALEVYGTTHFATHKAADRLGWPYKVFGVVKCYDLDAFHDWFFSSNCRKRLGAPEDLEQREPARFFAPSPGMVACPMCLTTWKSPDRKKHRYCRTCREKASRSDVDVLGTDNPYCEPMPESIQETP